jgi:hypothetical protein
MLCYRPLLLDSMLEHWVNGTKANMFAASVKPGWLQLHLV